MTGPTDKELLDMANSMSDKEQGDVAMRMAELLGKGEEVIQKSSKIFVELQKSEFEFSPAIRKMMGDWSIDFMRYTIQNVELRATLDQAIEKVKTKSPDANLTAH